MSERTNITQETAKEENETVSTQSSKMEFRLINPTEDNFLRVIKWNKEELETAVRQKMANYDNTVYTEDNIKQAKADRAELNKLTKAIEERRKMVKKIINEPYDIFEGELKNILALIQKPVAIIDKQVKLFEEKQKDEKKKNIQNYYDEIIGDLDGVLAFERVFDNRYLNQTYKLAAAKDDVKAKVEKVRTDLETIDSLESKFKLNTKDVYIKTLDLSRALAENKRLSELEEKLEAEKKRKAEEEVKRKHAAEELHRQEEKARAAEAASKENSIPFIGSSENTNTYGGNITKASRNVSEELRSASNTAENITTGIIPPAPDIKPEKEKQYRMKFYVKGTREQLNKLIQFINENGIEYGRIN